MMKIGVSKGTIKNIASEIQIQRLKEEWADDIANDIWPGIETAVQRELKQNQLDGKEVIE